MRRKIAGTLTSYPGRLEEVEDKYFIINLNFKQKCKLQYFNLVCLESIHM